MRRPGPGRRRVVIVTSVLLAGVTVVWGARTIDEAERLGAMDPADRALSQQLEANRRALHDRVGEIRSRHPGSSGLKALNELNRETGPTFHFLAMDEDGRTSAEVLLTASADLRSLFSVSTWHTSICLEVTFEPETTRGRGTITSAQTPCTVDPSPMEPERPPQRAGTIPLDLHRTTVPEPTTPPPDRPICYSGTDCTDVGG